MKKHSFLKSALIFVMIFAMMSMMLTAFATSATNKITIKANGQAGLGEADRFQAYSIFYGSTSAKDPDELTDLTWGDGVEKDDLIDAMKSDSTEMKSSQTFGEEFTEKYTEWESGHQAEYDDAMVVARFLNEHNDDPAYANAFARLVAAHLKPLNTESAETPGASSDGTKYNPYKSTATGEGWEIEVPKAGYYFVKDTYKSEAGNEEGDGAVSSYILRVIGTVEVDLKASVPTVEKKVEEQDGYETGTYTDLSYTLTGTVAENISEYSTYSYKFVDELTEGLSAKTEGLTVTVTADGLAGAPVAFEITTDYTVDLSPSGTDKVKHTLTVAFTDLKKSLERVAPSLNLPDPDVVNSMKIVVSYKASLNEYAVIGSAGNPNVVKLVYSNNPYESGEGETIYDEVKTYTIALKVLKQDEKKQPMQGVKFKLKNNEGKYATLKSVTEGDETYYAITGWENAPGGTELETDTQGVFNIHGLDIGTYTLEETKAKDDYEVMEPIVFDIKSDQTGKGYVNPDTGEMGNVTMVLDSTNEHRADVEVTSSSFADHKAQLTLTNYPSPILPHTGGIGRTIVLTVSSAAVLIGVVVIFVAVHKKSRFKI